MEALAKLMEQGKVRAVGVSNYTVEEVDQAAKVVELASVQPPYSMVNRGIEEDLLPYCIEHGIGVLPYSPLQRGLLTGKITMDYEFDEGDHRADNAYFKPVNRQRVLGFLDKIRPIAEAHDATLAQLVINWTIHRQGITSALVGARNEKQARENAQAAGFTLTEDETATINGHLDELELEL
jgi:aryl-alcohol dehydrogenase-like predicted oxidoreductase